MDLCQERYDFVLHFTHFSLVLGSVVTYNIYWEACAELFTTSVGLLGIGAVVWYGRPYFPGNGVLWRIQSGIRTYTNQSKIGI